MKLQVGRNCLFFSDCSILYRHRKYESTSSRGLQDYSVFGSFLRPEHFQGRYHQKRDLIDYREMGPWQTCKESQGFMLKYTK